MDTPYEIKEKVLIKIEDIYLNYGDKQILRGISEEVKDIYRPGLTQGQVVGILGRSGCGKTQFCRILAGLQKPTKGNILINKNSKMIPVSPGLVGVVPQNYPLFRHRTIFSNLMKASKLGGNKNPKERVMFMLSRFGLEDKINNYPIELSGGQRQRICIIQQILCSNYYLIMDEPFTGLDPLAKDDVAALIADVASLHEDNTIFVVAHDISAVASIADTLWLIGREQNESGIIPGSYIKKKYDLASMELAWHPELNSTPQFLEFIQEIKNEFKNL